jgi:hypothetical protein
MEIQVGCPYTKILPNGEEVIYLPLIIDGKKTLEVYTKAGEIIPELCIQDEIPCSKREQEFYLAHKA